MMEIQPLPFGFARRHAVLLDPSTAEDGSGVIVYSQQPLSLPLYSELRRYAKVPLKIERLSTDRFQKAMSELYEASSIQSRQSMEGIGDELEHCWLSPCRRRRICWSRRMRRRLFA